MTRDEVCEVGSRAQVVDPGSARSLKESSRLDKVKKGVRGWSRALSAYPKRDDADTKFIQLSVSVDASRVLFGFIFINPIKLPDNP